MWWRTGVFATKHIMSETWKGLCERHTVLCSILATFLKFEIVTKFIFFN